VAVNSAMTRYTICDIMLNYFQCRIIVSYRLYHNFGRFSAFFLGFSLPSGLNSSSLQPEQFRRQLKTTVMA